MGKTSKGGCKSTSHQLFKDKARTRLDDIQGMFKDLQFAMKESRTGDIAVLEERMNQTLSEWKAELNEPSPASSLNDGSFGSFSSDFLRVLVEDDASSELAHSTNPNHGSVTNAQIIEVGEDWDFHEIEGYFENQAPPELEFHGTDQFKASFSGQNTVNNTILASAQLDYHQYNAHHDIDHGFHVDINSTSQCPENARNQVSSSVYTVDPPSAFLGPKCALWDCARPAKRMEGCQDYCTSLHVHLAKEEGPPGSAPVMRCGGIHLRDDIFFDALRAKTLGKDVGIPECVGAATAKSPWKAPELFNLVLEGEALREWIFFDRPRRAFETGNRKQRSLPDYSGRGWHESRKQEMKEFGGLKRSYYMDPQPLQNLELHLYLYEINDSDTCALCRLVLKLPKGNVSDTAFADHQKWNTSLPPELRTDDNQSFRAREKLSPVDDECILVAQNQKAPMTENQKAPMTESCSYGDYFVKQTQQEHGSQGFNHFESSPTGMQYPSVYNLDVTNQLKYNQFSLHGEFENNSPTGFVGGGQFEEYNKHLTSGLQASVRHPSSTIIMPKCALWDCSRPAQGSDCCSMIHAILAVNEGAVHMIPVLRPMGISLKDGPLFASLSAKIQGKAVGIPECEGAATMKSPWNAPELFDIAPFEGETIREWLFFDKPRKAFESGNRKQRSLPDYKGRGWHASRKQELKEFGGVKKSYYMDPQPPGFGEWHLYEYELNDCSALTLLRLELKFAGGKKTTKGKIAKNSIVDLQKQMGRLTAELPADIEHFVKHEETAESKDTHSKFFSP